MHFSGKAWNREKTAPHNHQRLTQKPLLIGVHIFSQVTCIFALTWFPQRNLGFLKKSNISIEYGTIIWKNHVLWRYRAGRWPLSFCTVYSITLDKFEYPSNGSFLKKKSFNKNRRIEVDFVHFEITKKRQTRT